jgi:ABC-type multidrug transport system fused ATPase/permease subunit
MIYEILIALSTGVLGIFLGAQIAEGVLFVPYWKALQPKEFFELHQTYGKKIYQFFAPLTIVATLVPLLTVAYGFFTNIDSQLSLMLMGFFTALFFSTYFLYFKKANKLFAEASISHEDLPVELNKWGNWHWGRIVFEFIAFICSIVALTHL